MIGLAQGPATIFTLLFHPAYFAGSTFLFLPSISPTAISLLSSKFNVTPRTRTQFRAPLFLSPPGLSDSFSPTRKCHAAHDTALVRRWMNDVELGLRPFVHGHRAFKLVIWRTRYWLAPLVFRYSA